MMSTSIIEGGYLKQEAYDKILHYVHVGDVRMSKHPKHTNLVIFHYNRPRVWDEIKMQCRGLVVDTDTLEVIAKGHRKAFNIEETVRFQKKGDEEAITQKQLDLLIGYGLDSKCLLEEKVDGSMMLAFIYKGELIITTKSSFNLQGRFTSYLTNRERINLAYAIKNVSKKSGMGRITLIFEIYSPEHKIIIDYGDDCQFTLIGISNSHEANLTRLLQYEQYVLNTIDSKRFRMVNRRDIHTVSEIIDEDFYNNIKNRVTDNKQEIEGYFIKMIDGQSFKIKTNNYSARHYDKYAFHGVSDKQYAKMWSEAESDIEIKDILDKHFNFKRVCDKMDEALKNTVLIAKDIIKREKLHEREDFMKNSYIEGLSSREISVVRRVYNWEADDIKKLKQSIASNYKRIMDDEMNSLIAFDDSLEVIKLSKNDKEDVEYAKFKREQEEKSKGFIGRIHDWIASIGKE